MIYSGGFPGGSVVKDPPANAGDAGDSGDAGSTPGWEDSLEKEEQPTPVFFPGKPRDRGAWWAKVHGAAKCWTWLSMHTDHTQIYGNLIHILSLSQTHTHTETGFQIHVWWIDSDQYNVSRGSWKVLFDLINKTQGKSILLQTLNILKNIENVMGKTATTRWDKKNSRYA